jgi:hypothetical protein
MNLHFRHPTRWVAWSLVVGQIICGNALAQRRGATLVPPKPDKSDTATAAETKDIGQDWVRLKYDSTGEPIAMQTAIVRYTPVKSNGKAGAGVSVDLIGAVHIGDAAYYRKLNRQFTQYDALLYELVAPEGTKVPLGRGTSNGHPIGAMQNMAKDFLELDHQLEYVDYTRPNFIHADMSPDEFAQAMKDRNESFLQMYFKLLGSAMAEQSKMAAKGDSNDLDLITALFANDRPRRLKIILAKQLSEMESLMVSFGGEDGSVIISDRNKKALAVLKTQMASGKKHVGIFYGAGHLSDMDKHLRTDFHLQPASITWLTAWDLAAKQ